MTLIIPGADAAILGVVQRCGQAPFVVYDPDKLVAHFMGQGMTEEEAQEWVTFNIKGAWVGDGTPGVLYAMDRDELDELADTENPADLRREVWSRLTRETS